MCSLKYLTILGHLLGYLSQYAAVPSSRLSMAVHMRSSHAQFTCAVPSIACRSLQVSNITERTVSWWRRSASYDVAVLHFGSRRFEIHCVDPYLYRGVSGSRTTRPYEMKALCSFETPVKDCLVRRHCCKNLQIGKLLVVCGNTSGPPCCCHVVHEHKGTKF